MPQLAAAAKPHACCLFAAIHCEKPFISIRAAVSKNTIDYYNKGSSCGDGRVEGSHVYLHETIMKYKSRVVRKPAFCICENKDVDQLLGNREADQRLCFRYIDSTIPLLSKDKISSLWPSSVAVQPCLCGT